MLTREWSDELGVFTRAFAGAAVFGIPLTMTMEMWWIGKTLSIHMLVAILVVGLIANFGLAWVAGFRTDHSLAMSIDQSIDALAVGVVSASILLLTLNQLRLNDGIEHAVNTVILLAVPLSLGASVARLVFKDSSGRTGENSPSLSSWHEVISDIGATAIGGVFIGISIAPTDEVAMIAAGLSQWYVLGIIGLSLLLSWVIVFASGFDEASPEGAFQHPFTETILTYVVSLVVAAGFLLLFERITFDDPPAEIIRQTVVLALPAAIGGAGGRLVV